MSAPPSRFRVGDAEVTAFRVADLSMTPEEVFGNDPALSRYFDAPLTAAETLPNYSFLVSAGPLRVVVDPGEYSRLVAPGHFNAPEGYAPPPSLTDQMRAAGADPAGVTHAVVTHLHYDHFDGLTVPGSLSLAFPRAPCLVPRRDWDMADMADARAKGDRDVVDTLGVAEKAGVLELLDGKKELGPGVSVEPYPGESPGHQIVAVRSGRESCYIVGDLYHMKEEVEHPELAAIWTDRDALVSSRKRFAETAAAESALVLPGHMAPGRIAAEGGATRWAPL